MEKLKVKSYTDYLKENSNQVEDMEEALKLFHSNNHDWGKPISFAKTYRKT